MSDELEFPATVRAIFDREILAMEANLEPSPMIDWLTGLRDEVLATLDEDEAFYRWARKRLRAEQSDGRDDADR